MHIFFSGWDEAIKYIKADEENEDNPRDIQKIDIEAEYPYERACELIQFIVDRGFSIKVSSTGKIWHIEAEK